MEFDWNDLKEAEVRAERGHGFGVPVPIFLGRTVEWEDDRADYGEDRIFAVGRVQGRHWTLVYVNRGPVPLDRHSLAVVEMGARAMARMTLEQIVQANPQVDAVELDAATEADIRRWQIEDGFDPDARSKEVRVVLPPRAIRMALSMTQEEFAAALRIPVATLRNWEQGRVMPDPAARSLLTIVAHDAKAAFAALAA